MQAAEIVLGADKGEPKHATPANQELVRPLARIAGVAKGINKKGKDQPVPKAGKGGPIRCT